MSMDQNNYDRYLNEFKCYKEYYNLPFIKTRFNQDDSNAMNYCLTRDFVVLVVPFGDPEGGLRNRVIVQNNLVSYTKMYSNLLGGSAVPDGVFLSSAINMLKKRISLKGLEEFTPIALIENAFSYEEKTKSHYGVAFMARIPKNKNIATDLVHRTINDTFYFANEHNKELFSLAQKFVEEYKINRERLSEIKYARRINYVKNKEAKENFVKDNGLDLSDYYAFKRKIVDDIKIQTPKSVMDIACGDDDLIYDFLNIGENVKVFANDIAVSYLEHYHFKKNGYEKIYFSNLNAVELPFNRKSLDIMLCKNLLHHLSKKDRKRMLSNCLKICKTMVLVEILCYNEQNSTGKLLHDKFYGAILQETNKEYLSAKDIDNLLLEYNVIKNEIVNTQNGIYKYVWVTERTDKV